MASRWSCPHCGSSVYEYDQGTVSCDGCLFTERWRDWKKRSEGGSEKPGRQRKTAPPPPPPPPPPPLIDATMLRRLIHLCHPDKHSGSEASITATQFLLKLKEASEK